MKIFEFLKGLSTPTIMLSFIATYLVIIVGKLNGIIKRLGKS